MPMHNLLAGFDQSIRERIEQMSSKIMVHLFNHGEFGEKVFSFWNPWQRAARTVKLGQKDIKYQDLDHYFSDRRHDFGWQ